MFSKIKLLLLDVDGVLSSPYLTFDKDGEEIKSFSVRDGYAITIMLKAGIPIGIITGRSSKALDYRLSSLGIKMVYKNCPNKLPIYEEIISKLNLKDNEVAYMGDDLLDLPILKRVGLPAAPIDAEKEVKAVAKFISQKPGGKGAVRDLIEAILKTQKKWPVVQGIFSLTYKLFV